MSSARITVCLCGGLIGGAVLAVMGAPLWTVVPMAIGWCVVVHMVMR